MAYTRPLPSAASATWQGASAYTRPLYTAGDGTFQEASNPDAVGVLAVAFPAPTIALIPTHHGAIVSPITVSAALAVQDTGLVPAITGQQHQPGEYVRPHVAFANASWKGASGYARPPYDFDIATWTDGDPVLRARLAISFPAPAIAAPGFSAAERPAQPGDHLWAKAPIYRPAPLDSLNGAGHAVGAIAAAATLPEPPIYTITIAASAERVEAATAQAELPPAALYPLLPRIRERHQPVTLTAALEVPVMPIALVEAGGIMLQNGAAAAALPLHPLGVPTAAASGYRIIDLPETPEDAGIITGDPLLVRHSTAEQQGEKQVSRVSLQEQQMIAGRAPCELNHQRGDITPGRTSFEYAQMERLGLAAAEPIVMGIPLGGRNEIGHTEAIRTRNRADTQEQHGQKIEAHGGAPHAEAIRTRNHASAHQQQGERLAKFERANNKQGEKAGTGLTVAWQQGAKPDPGYWWPYTWKQCQQFGIPYSRPTYQSDTSWQGAAAYTRPPLHCGAGWIAAEPPLPPPPIPTIPLRRVYFVIPDIQVKRLSDNLPIAASSVEISLDADSHTWSGRATLLGQSALDAVQPGVDGTPITLAVYINGYDWHMVVMDWEESRQFGQRGVSVNLRGLTAELAEPWQLKQSGTTASLMTVQQALAALLPLGWGLSWTQGTPDWLVPAGAWSWNNQTPIGAIHEAAASVGLMVIPAGAARTLTIAPRYKVAPWEYLTTTPDLVIPEAAITKYTRQQPIPSQANAVFVHGGNVGGVIGQVKRTGTAGDRAAETASSQLVTHSDAARLLGTRRIAAAWQQPTWRSVTMPLGGVDYPLVQLGQLISISANANSDRGVVSSISISATVDESKASVRQTFSLGERSGNSWARFRSLIPGEPTQLGTIAAVDAASGTAQITLLGGGAVRARGTGTVGDQVYIKGEIVQGTAPTLPSYAIEV